MRGLCVVAMLAISIAVAGCMFDKSLAAEARETIDAVMLVSDVVVPDEATFVVHGHPLFGPVPAFIALFSETHEEIPEHMERFGIDIGSIVRSKFLEKARRHEFLGTRLRPDAAVRISLEVQAYGLKSEYNGGYFMPVLECVARMHDADGTLLWRQAESLGMFTNMEGLVRDVPAYEVSRYFSDPSAFRNAFWVAADLVVNDILADL